MIYKSIGSFSRVALPASRSVLIVAPSSTIVRLSRAFASKNSATPAKPNHRHDDPHPSIVTSNEINKMQKIRDELETTHPARSPVQIFEDIKNTLTSPLGVAALGGLAALYIGYEATSVMSSITFANVGFYAFIGGLMTSATGLLAVVGAGRAFSTRSNYFLNQTLARVKRNSKAVVALGGANIKGGTFKAFNIISGAEQLKSKTPHPDFPEEQKSLMTKVNKMMPGRTLQLMFVVEGAAGQRAMVSAQVEKQGTKSVYDTVYMTDLKTGERTVLEGRSDILIYEQMDKFISGGDNSSASRISA